MAKCPDNQTEELLRKLVSADAGSAWNEFLNQHAGLIMKTAGQFEYDQDRLTECFLFVCEKLSESGFRRLLRYRARPDASFRSWLVTVIFNLCVDWHRKEVGRASLSPAITALPAFDQLVYRYIFEQGMTRHECLQVLATDFPRVTGEMVSEAAARIHRILSPRKRWQLSVRLHRQRRSAGMKENALTEFPGPEGDPSRAAEEQQQLEQLKTVFNALPARQRLLLHFRFHDGLTLEQIARILGLGDSNRTWRHIQAALQTLSDQYLSEKTQKRRKK